MDFRNLTLEMSLKPFRDKSDENIVMVCDTLFEQWRQLIRRAETVSLLLWVADGSEILTYRGKPEDTFDWGRYIGIANPPPWPENITLPPDRTMPPPFNPRLYCDNPPEFTYADLKRIIEFIRQRFQHTFARKLRVGATFDPGPEFAKSEFKYRRHREICLGNTIGNRSFVCCYSTLNADTDSYAAFPNGITAGTSLGSFLGRQVSIYADDLGFDYLWLSNGFGFGLETWGLAGAVFDGTGFSNDKCPSIRTKIFQFWHDFRLACPDLPLESRGTNFSTGKDLSSDGVPLREIYRKVSNLQPPPNSPWAALTGDFGLELSGWMSHIAELPETSFPFRFYLHDPWFLNSPWLDRYGRSPHDLYLPLSIARLDAAGAVTLPDSLAFLTVDDSYGRMPEEPPREIIPPLLYSWDHAPDEAGPLVWLYPFNEYHEMTFSGRHIEDVFFGDWFIRTAINCGLPLNTVISSSHFLNAVRNEKHDFNDRILVVPTAIAENLEILETVLSRLNHDGKVLFYGPIRHTALQQLFHLNIVDAISGECELVLTADESNGRKSFHDPVISGGSLDMIVAPTATGVKTVAAYRFGNQTRTAAAVTDGHQGKGRAAWVRGSNSFRVNVKAHQPEMLSRKEFDYPEMLMRMILKEFDYSITSQKMAEEQPDHVITLRYHRHALYLAGYTPDLTIPLLLRFPAGAPLFTNHETFLSNGHAKYYPGRAVNWECRVFIEQENGWVSCRTPGAEMPGISRRLNIDGLEKATVRFLPESGQEDRIEWLHDHNFYNAIGTRLAPTTVRIAGRIMQEVTGISGKLLISW